MDVKAISADGASLPEVNTKTVKVNQAACKNNHLHDDMTLLALCEWNPPDRHLWVERGSSTGVDVFFDVIPNKLLNM